MAKKDVKTGRLIKMVNTKTGEVEEFYLEDSKTIMYDGEEIDRFIMLYLQANPELYSLTNLEFKVFAFLVENTKFNSSEVVFNKTTKVSFLNRAGISNQSFNNAISSLVKKGVVFRRERGEYYINPKYAWKGDKSVRRRLLKIEFSMLSKVEPNTDFDKQ